MCVSLDRKASVGTTPGTAFVHDDCGSGQGFAWIKFRDLVILSCYWRPGITLGEYFLGEQDQAIRSMGDISPLIVGGDFKA